MTSSESAVRRLEAALDRIAEPGSQGDVIFTKTLTESARREAVASDARTSTGESLGALDGRIVSVKALFDIAGEVTSAGSALLRTQPAARHDAGVVDRLRQAGAVVIGRTHMTEFAFSAVGVNPHDGSPGNPFDESLIAGGSSTGAALSVAKAMAEIAIGSDTGGSIRIPAALCGVVGFKPTAGLIPTDGVFPLSPSLDVVGPLAASVADCAVAFHVLSHNTPQSLPVPAVSSIKLTLVHGRLSDDAEGPVAAAVGGAVDRLRKAGVTLQDGSIEAELDQLAALDAVGMFPGVELAATLRSMGLDELSSVDPRTLARIVASKDMAAVDYIRARKMRAAIIAAMDARLASGEILVLPTVPIQAVQIVSMSDPARFQRINALLLRNTRVANLFDLPAVSLPIAADGAPVGLMLMARRGDDQRLLTIAAAIEQTLAE